MKDQAASYLERLVYERACSPHTLRAYTKDLSAFLDFCGGHNISDPNALKPKHISLWLENLSREGLEARSIARKISAASSFFVFLCKNNQAEHNPFEFFHAPKARKNIPLTAPPEEMLAVLEGLPENTILEQRNKIIFITLYGTGLRSEELCALRLEDIFWERKVLYILGKGGKERLIPLLPAVYIWMSRWKSLRPSLDKGISGSFFLSHKGFALETSFLRRLCSALPFHNKNFHPHAFRYSFASHLLDEGAGLRCIQELLGHSKVATTERYTKIGIERLRKQYLQHHPHA